MTKTSEKTRTKVRVAMIGAGGMANSVHYPSLSSFDDVEMVAICDLDPNRLNTTADKYHIQKRYTDYKKMIEENTPDAVKTMEVAEKILAKTLLEGK